MSALHCGSPGDAERDLAPLRAFGTPLADTVQPKTYLASQHMNDEAMQWGHRFYMKSAFTTSVPDDLVDRCVEQVVDAPGDCSFSLWAWGGAIARVPEDATAFTGRDAAFWVSAEALWDDPDLDAAHVQWGGPRWRP